jgi:putative nucleotidyltransferase with HDIG domain
MIVVFDKTLPFSFEDLGTRRISMAFIQRPFETDLLLDYLFEFAPITIAPEELKFHHLAPVRLSDIRPDEKFKFDLFFYMPANQKCLLYRRKDSTMTSAQIKRFQEFNIPDLYVRKTELKAFNEYAAKKIKSTLTDKEIPATEKRLILQKKVKDLFAGFFDTSTVDSKRNRAILNTCKQVASQLITELSPRPQFFEQILGYTAQAHSNFNHSVNVSVYTTLFALSLGVEDVESASIGGMLHDIGLSSLPEALTKKNESEMSAEDKKLYHSHTVEGVSLLERKKVFVNDTVKAIIEQHHEHMDGTGYPRGLVKDKIQMLARICQIANEFDKLTAVHKEGPGVMAPRDAFLHLIDKNQTVNGGEKLDQLLLQQLKGIFCEPEKHLIKIDDAKKKFESPLNFPKEADTDLKRRKRFKKVGF